MPRETQAAKTDRIREILAALAAAYPRAHCELNHRNPLELLVATILSAQCTDKRVNLVTAELFNTYRSAADFASAPLPDLEAAIRTTGFFRNKAKNIQACCRQLVKLHGGRVPRSMDELTALAGAGRKTANVVLGNAFGLNVGVVVDTHVARLSQRLGLTRETTPEKIEPDLMKLVPQAQWTLFSHWLIWHGRRRCAARKPDCGQCELQKLCPRTGVAQPERGVCAASSVKSPRVDRDVSTGRTLKRSAGRAPAQDAEALGLA
jgi:endonuclease-3